MLSIERCKEILADKAISDLEIEKLRGSLYVMIEAILDDYFEEFNGKINICKKL